MPNNNQIKNIRCSFCGKAQEQVQRIIAGPGVYICDECIRVCTGMFACVFHKFNSLRKLLIYF